MPQRQANDARAILTREPTRTHGYIWAIYLCVNAKQDCNYYSFSAQSCCHTYIYVWTIKMMCVNHKYLPNTWITNDRERANHVCVCVCRVSKTRDVWNRPYSRELGISASSSVHTFWLCSQPAIFYCSCAQSTDTHWTLGEQRQCWPITVLRLHER